MTSFAAFRSVAALVPATMHCNIPATPPLSLSLEKIGEMLNSASKQKPAPPASAYQAFCQEQRALLPGGPFAPGEREKLLSKRWKALSKAERAHYSGLVTMSPYNAFCQVQRPLLPAALRNRDREAVLGQLWAALPKAERVKYEVGGSRAPAPAPVPAAPVPAQAPPTASAPPLIEEDRSKGKRAKTAARDSPSAAPTTAPPAPLPPLAPLRVAQLAPLAPPAPIHAPLAPLHAQLAQLVPLAPLAPPPAPAPLSFALTAPSTASISPTASSSTSTDTNNDWEEFLGLDDLFVNNSVLSLEAQEDRDYLSIFLSMEEAHTGGLWALFCS